jgi:hypothetical protein
VPDWPRHAHEELPLCDHCRDNLSGERTGGPSRPRENAVNSRPEPGPGLPIRHKTCMSRRIPHAKHGVGRETSGLLRRWPAWASASRRFNRKGEKGMALPDFSDAPAAGSWCSLRPPDPPLEPEDGALHLRRPQQHPHHRSRADGADAAPGPEGGERHRRQRAARSASSAPSARRTEIIADSAKRSAQYYVNARWLGGMLTNWKTISNCRSSVCASSRNCSPASPGLHQEGAPEPQRERDKLERALGGIKDMGGTPT